MSIKTLKAVSYLGCFDTGVTKPIKASCVNDIGEIEGEYAVKLRTKVNDAETSLFSELIASRIANKIGIQTPSIAFINITSDFAISVEDEIIKEDLLNNIGLHLGQK